MTTAFNETFSPGQFFGSYHIVKRLGAGAAGEVLLVDAPMRNRQFALKVLRTRDLDRDSGTIERFIREAEFAMKNTHPHIVPVYDAGMDEETGYCYLAMEYMAYGSLAGIIADNPRGLGVARALDIGRQIAEALVMLERNSLVHRDVKPGNILVSGDGSVKLSDLGISLFRRDGENAAHRTNCGETIGTPAYMAPEQMLDAHNVDIRADIYSFGIILYEMLTGKRPNHGNSAMTTLARQLEGMRFQDIASVRKDIPAELAKLVNCMIDPEPEMRPRTAIEVLTKLQGISAKPPSLRSCEKDGIGTKAKSVDKMFLYSIFAAFGAFCFLAFAVYRILKGGR